MVNNNFVSEPVFCMQYLPSNKVIKILDNTKSTRFITAISIKNNAKKDNICGLYVLNIIKITKFEIKKTIIHLKSLLLFYSYLFFSKRKGSLDAWGAVACIFLKLHTFI